VLTIERGHHPNTGHSVTSCVSLLTLSAVDNDVGHDDLKLVLEWNVNTAVLSLLSSALVSTFVKGKSKGKVQSRTDPRRPRGGVEV
jgi:hypothetical protein